MLIVVEVGIDVLLGEFEMVSEIVGGSVGWVF